MLSIHHIITLSQLCPYDYCTVAIATTFPVVLTCTASAILVFKIAGLETEYDAVRVQNSWFCLKKPEGCMYMYTHVLIYVHT